MTLILSLMEPALLQSFVGVKVDLGDKNATKVTYDVRLDSTYLTCLLADEKKILHSKVNHHSSL